MEDRLNAILCFPKRGVYDDTAKNPHTLYQ